jgi:uncharacterized protein (TIGR02996 family)
MSDREALLSAIIAHPDEDTPRLVFADWLDEHSGSKRAAFIRSRVEYQRLRSADTDAAALDGFLAGYAEGLDRIDWSAVDPELGACVSARRAVEERHLDLTVQSEKLPAPEGAGVAGAARGFYEHIWVSDAGAFLAHADAVFRAAPITAVDFFQLTADEAKKFAAAGHLARIRKLLFNTDVDPGAIRALGNHRDAAGVRWLELANPDSAGSTLEALAGGKYWTGLRHLEAAHLSNEEDAPGAGQLAGLFARPQFRNLRALVMPDSGVDDGAVAALAKHLPELRLVNLGDNPITGRSLSALAEAKALRHLRVLDLRDCEPSGDPAPLITTARLPNLRILHLGGAECRGPTAKGLMRPGRGPGLRVLDLSESVLSAAGCEALAACPAIHGAWHLTLAGTGIGDEHLERFIKSAAFTQLVGLNLGYNAITDAGAQALAAWPGAASLRWLGLSANPIGEAGERALAASPHLKGLRYLLDIAPGTALRKRFKGVLP